MSERQKSPYDSIAGRWLVLVERRQQNFIELCNSGRWRHYYTQAQFIEEMRKVLQLRDQWARLAGLASSNKQTSNNRAWREEKSNRRAANTATKAVEVWILAQ